MSSIRQGNRKSKEDVTITLSSDKIENEPSQINIEEENFHRVRSIKDDTKTTYKEKEVGIFGLFRYRTRFDCFLISAGLIFSISMGASLPVLGIIFGRMTDVFIDVTKRGFKNVTLCDENSIIYDQIGCSSEGWMTIEEFLSYMGTCSVYYLLIAFFAFISGFIQTFCWEYTCERQIYHLRKIYLLQVLRQDVSWYEQNTDGNLDTKLSEDIERIREGMGAKLGLLIQFHSTFFIGVAIGLYAHWQLTLYLLILFPAIFWVAGYSSQGEQGC